MDGYQGASQRGSFERSVGASKRGDGFRREFFFVDRGHGERAGKRVCGQIGQNLEQVVDRSELFSRQHIEQRMCLLALLCEIGV